MEKVWKLKGLLQSSGWVAPCYIKTDSHGKIVSIDDTLPVGALNVEIVNGYAIPGFQNAHSHSFQYAMGGLAEIHPDPLSNDDFWSWRDTMYNIALSMDPDQFEAIATMLYSEMLAHGYTDVAEFHYVHHDKNGNPYNNLAEMGSRLIAAADQAGINITLVPIFYQKGGFATTPSAKQRRFISKDAEAYLDLLEASKAAIKEYNQATIGLGIHSLRAVDESSMREAIAAAQDVPIHIHIAEQLKEIADCEQYYGQRPVAWMMDHFDVNEQFHLVHATHLDQKEVNQIIDRKAHVVLCPSTEGNLGDGLFPLNQFQNLGGKWSIGTDSHIGLNPLEELRWFDYGQRLATHKRNQLVSSTNGDSGKHAFEMALSSGRKAMGNYNENFFEVGQPFDAVILDGQSPLLAVSELKNVLSTLIYTGDRQLILGTIVHGDWKVKQGKHLQQEEILNGFVHAVNKLKIR